MGDVIEATETGSTMRVRSGRAAMGIALAIVLAISSAGCSSQTSSSQTPGQNPGEMPGASNPVAWVTNNVSLTASDFWIVADGQIYLANPNQVDVHSDPGTPTYTTLELVWSERSREMRYFIYFQADGTKWWSDEMRTYDGQPSPNTDWLFYYGRFFQSPYGSAFHGDIDVSNTASDTIHGELHVHGIDLSIRWTTP